MRWSMGTCLGAALALIACGCRANGRRDAIEAELRAREADVHTLRTDLEREQLMNRLLVGELAALHGAPGPDGMPRPPSEPYPVQSVVLGRQTAGRFNDRLGGDDALQVQIEPRDTEGQAIKAPGSVFVEVFEVSPEGVKSPLSSWAVSREELRGKWQSGLFSSGYLLTLPWKVPPVTEKLRVAVRFQMLSGRLFEADKDIPIRVLPGAREQRKAPPPPAELAPMPKFVGPLPEKPKEAKPPGPEKKELPPPTEEGPVLMRGQAGGRIDVLKPQPLPPDEALPVVED